MGKKKGKSSKKGKKIVDGISTAEMTREQLMGHIRRLQHELEREREERNFFMLEREKLFSLWSLALEKITTEKDKSQLREIHLDNTRENKEEEINSQKQKIRFLISEHLKKLATVRLDYLNRIKKFQERFWKVEFEFRETLTNKNTELSNIQQCLLHSVQELKIQHSENISQLRKTFSNELRRIELETERSVIKQREIVHFESKQDLIFIQVTKDEQINQLIQTHEKQLLQLKNYFRELTINNLAIISSLQEEVGNKKSQGEKLESQLTDSQIKCKQLSQRIKEQETKMIDWSTEDKRMASRINEVQRMDKKVEMNKRYAKSVEIANESLIQKNLELKKKSDFLKRGLGNAIMEMQMKSTMARLRFEFQIDKTIS